MYKRFQDVIILIDVADNIFSGRNFGCVLQRKHEMLKTRKQSRVHWLEESFFSNTQSWQLCLNELNSNDISWTLWNYKVTGGGTNSWGLYNMPIESANVETDTFDTIKEKWSKCNSSYQVQKMANTKP